MTREEQETIIRFDRAEDEATIYTADPSIMRRLKGLSSYKLEREDRQAGKVVAMTFRAGKELILMRSKPLRIKLTDEERARRAEQMRQNANSEQSLS